MNHSLTVSDFSSNPNTLSTGIQMYLIGPNHLYGDSHAKPSIHDCRDPAHS